MREQVIFLIYEGLGYENLQRLIEFCQGLFDENPILYDTLVRIFTMLIDEYDDQGIPYERYETIMQRLQQPLLDVLEGENASAEVFLARLNILLRAFRSLPPYTGIH